MLLIMGFSIVLEALLYAFSKNISYIFLVFSAFTVYLLIVSETPKFKIVSAILCGAVLSVSFYFVYNAYVAFGAYIADYSFMLLRLIVLTVIGITVFLPNKRQKEAAVND